MQIAFMTSVSVHLLLYLQICDFVKCTPECTNVYLYSVHLPIEHVVKARIRKTTQTHKLRFTYRVSILAAWGQFKLGHNLNPDHHIQSRGQKIFYFFFNKKYNVNRISNDIWIMWYTLYRILKKNNHYKVSRAPY